MGWTRFDDNFHEQPEMDFLSDSAALLHVCATTWCNCAGTDGFVPTERVKRLKGGSVQAAEELCREIPQLPGHKPWWVKVEGGYQVRSFLKFNASAEEVREAKAATAKRVAAHRAKEPSEAARNTNGNALRNAKSNAERNTGGNAKSNADGNRERNAESTALPPARATPTPTPTPIPKEKQAEKEMPVTGAGSENSVPEAGKPPGGKPAQAPSGLVSSSTSPSGPEPPPSVDAMIGRVASRKALEPDPPGAVAEADRRRERNRELAEELRKRQEAAS